MASVLSIGIVLAIVGRLHDAVGEGTIPAGKILLGLGALVLLTGPALAVVRRSWATPVGKALVVFCAALYLSLPLSLLRSDTLAIAFAFVTRTVPFILIMVVAMRGVGDISRLLRSMVVMQILMGVLIAAGFGVVLNGADGARTTLAGSYDPNDLALVMAACGAASLWALRDKQIVWRVAGLAGLVLGMYVIIRTYSRGGAISLAVMVIMSLVLARQAVPMWLRLAMFPAVAAALLLAPQQYIERLSTLGTVSQDYNITDETGRAKIWKRGFGYFLSRPLTGVGAGQFGQAEGRYGREELGRNAGWKWSAAHNMYVESLAELGLPGFLGLLGMLVPSVTLWWRVRAYPPRSDEELQYQRQVETVAVAVITFMVGAVFLSATYSPMVMLLTALGIALRSVPPAARFVGRARPGRSSRRRARAAPIAVSAGLTPGG
ncbi:O-antigen ligase family protein [Gemmatimonas sp.]|jgi:O-antigen ligase|uniref:O-antigen ligase family protein n=1 Tax=Gemmatimonas sp. TaxID=1962908 RepID=UPI0037BF11AF